MEWLSKLIQIWIQEEKQRLKTRRDTTHYEYDKKELTLHERKQILWRLQQDFSENINSLILNSL